jgi:S1-C subfamily serine protease
VNAADWVAVVVITLTAFSGIRRGFVTGVFSLIGLLGGAVFGAELAPKIVGDLSGYVPLVALVGAALGGMLGQTAGVYVGRAARQGFSAIPPLRILDTAGGIVLGGLTGLAFCWAVGAVLLYVPGQSELRRLAQESTVVSTLTEALPPERVIDAVGRIDPFTSIAGPSIDVDEPEPAIARDPQVRAARESVVRVRGFACGIGIEGSGWIVGRGLVVTNAHVVAGLETPVVDRGDGRGLEGRVVSFDSGNDIAIVRVPGLKGRPLGLAEPERGRNGAMLGFPLNGPYRVTPVRLGSVAPVAARDTYGRVQIGRKVVGVRGDVQSGNSGGPVVDADGRVVTTAFAKRAAFDDEGYGVPNDKVRDALANVGKPLTTACVVR